MALGPIGGSWDGNGVVGEREGGVGGSVGDSGSAGVTWAHYCHCRHPCHIFCSIQPIYTIND